MRYPEFDGTQLCTEMDSDLFFPPTGGMGLSLAREAKKICGLCEWQYECGEWALLHADPYGIYGGMTPQDRQVVRKHRGIVADVFTLTDVFGRKYSKREDGAA